MSTQFNKDFPIEYSAGRIPKKRRFALAGVNNNIPVGIETHLWRLGGIYPQITNPAGVQLYASSTDIGDNSLGVAFGIDNETNGLLTIRFFQLDGQNKVPLSGLMFRVFGHAMLGTGNFNGKIYIYEDDVVIGGVPQTFSKIKSFSENLEDGANGIFRVPNNSTGYVDNYKILKDEDKKFILNQKDKDFGTTNFRYTRFKDNLSYIPFSPRFTLSTATDLEFSVIAKDNKSDITFLGEGVLEFE